MIIVFKSAVSADLVYFGDVAKHLIELMGKEATERGIVTVEQLPGAIARLDAAIAADRPQHRAHLLAEENCSESDAQGGQRPFVSLTQRAVPLLEMLKEALKEKVPVVWGV